MTNRSLLSFTCALALSGCIIIGPDPGPDPRPNLPAPGSGAARPDCSTTRWSFIAGNQGVSGQNQSGYVITASSGSIRVTWFGFQYFNGSIFTAPGSLTKFYPGCTDNSCALVQGMDQVVLGNGDPDRIDFVGTPGSSLRKGFDIEVRGGVVWFDLLIEGRRQPTGVRFVSADTSQVSTAETLPLGLAVKYGPGSGRGQPAQNVTTHLIDFTQMPPKMQDNTFGVATTDGKQWLLDWQPSLDGCPHEFRGSVFSDVAFAGVTGAGGLQLNRDIIFQTGARRIDFISMNNMSVLLPAIGFNNLSGLTYFDLAVDGVDAKERVYFTSNGRASVNAVNPFALDGLP